MKNILNNPFFWSGTEDALLKQSYLNKIKKSEILNLFPNRTYAALKHRAKILKIKKCRVQVKNEMFFQAPNLTNCSVAGMIASDGNVQIPHQKNGYRVIISLARKDREILENINTVTTSNAIITDSQVKTTIRTERVKVPIEKTYPISYITFSAAQKWMADLQKHWNITPNKSLTLTAPNILHLDLSLAYIVGLINGDGSIGLQKTPNKNYLYIRVLGTKTLLEWVKARFEEVLGASISGAVRPERPDSSIYLLQVNGGQAITLFRVMNAIKECIKLRRKWENPEILKIVTPHSKLSV